jgi:hypothetical protein
MSEGMKIIGFKIDGMRKLKAVELKFGENGLFVVKGQNENGKTTLWKALQWMIEGNKHLNQDIIQHGKDKLTGELTLEEYVIKRSATRKGTNILEVRNTKTNANEKGEVQNFLSKLVNVLTFDPRPFAKKTATEKYQFCLQLFREQLEDLSKEKLGYGFLGIDTKLVSLEEDRKLKGREVKAFGDLDKDAPEKVERVDISATLAKKAEIERRNTEKRNLYNSEKQKDIERINNFNQTQSYLKEKLVELKNDVKHYQDKVDDTQTKIENLKKQLSEEESNLAALQMHLTVATNNLLSAPQPEAEKPLIPEIVEPEYEFTTNEDSLIQNALAINQKAEVYENWLKKKADKDTKQVEYGNFTDQIESLRRQKKEILLQLNTGVPNLEIREDGIFHNDIYCDNWSDAQGLKISCELAYANLPPIRAIFIDQGEGLDKNARKELEKFAKEKDILIGVSIVADELTEEDKHSDNVFWIEDGTVSQAKEELPEGK